jgi:hypothetical protein
MHVCLAQFMRLSIWTNYKPEKGVIINKNGTTIKTPLVASPIVFLFSAMYLIIYLPLHKYFTSY